MSQLEVDRKNRRFWDELCGSGLARHLGVTAHDPDSLKRFDRGFFDLYPYVSDYVPYAKLPGKKLLEIGLGYGTLGQHLAEQGCEYHGLDIAEGPVRMMCYRLGMLGVENPESRVTQGSVLEIPHADATFDYVYSIGCLHHTGDLTRSIAEVFRVLKPGGTAMIMLYNARGFRQLVKAPILDVFHFLRGPRRWLRSRRERVRAMYDTNAAGDAAPHTDYTSPNQARELFSKFANVVVKKENADPMFYTGRGWLIPREKLLNNLGKWMGLDLYITAVKGEAATQATPARRDEFLQAA